LDNIARRFRRVACRPRLPGFQTFVLPTREGNLP
jgi:hypothetical protein